MLSLGQVPGMLLNTPQCTGRPATEEDPAKASAVPRPRTLLVASHMVERKPRDEG